VEIDPADEFHGGNVSAGWRIHYGARFVLDVKRFVFNAASFVLVALRIVILAPRRAMQLRNCW